MFGNLFNNVNWGDLWGGLSGLMDFSQNGLSFYKSMFGNQGNQNYGGGGQGGMNSWNSGPPGMGQGMDMGWLSEMMAGWQEQMGAQQEMMAQEQKKGLARSAASARKGLQSQGVGWDPDNPNVGAGGVDAIASQLGIPPDELLAALKQYGGEYGFEGFGGQA